MKICDKCRSVAPRLIQLDNAKFKYGNVEIYELCEPCYEEMQAITREARIKWFEAGVEKLKEGH